MEATVEAFAAAADNKGTLLRQSRRKYFILSALAGAYVGLGIALIFAIGAPLYAAHSPFLKTVMGASFGVALALVIFAGAELFTGEYPGADPRRAQRSRVVEQPLRAPRGEHDAAVAGPVPAARRRGLLGSQNMVPVTLGNIAGGTLFVGGLYWLAAPVKKLQRTHLVVVASRADAA